MYSGGFSPFTSAMFGFMPGAGIAPDFNASGRNPQAYIDSIIYRGTPLGAPPMIGMPPPPMLPVPVAAPADRFRRESENAEQEDEQSAPSWLDKRILRWPVYGLAVYGLWKLGLDVVVRNLFK